MKTFSRSFDPLVIKKISNLRIIAKEVARGVISGIHKSKHKGSSIEFLEHKKYSQCDDIRQIDWKLFARSDRHYIKQFEDETNITVRFLLDTSGSMGYKSALISKLEYAVTLAASMSYLFINQSDSVGVYTFNDKILNNIPPKSESAHFNYIVKFLETVSPQGETNISDSLISFSEKIKKQNTIIVISDFFDDTSKIIKLLKQLSHRKNNVILFHVLDPYELEFPFKRPANFVSMEDGRSLVVDPGTIKEDYIKKIKKFIESFRNECFSNKIDYFLVNTSESVEKTIINCFQSAGNNNFKVQF